MGITRRAYRFGTHHLNSYSHHNHDAPYIVAGERMYVLGHGSGEVKPIGDEHLVGEMGGIWAHPVKVGDGVLLALHDAYGEPLPIHDAHFTEQPTEACWQWASGSLQVTRRDRVVPSAAALAVQCSIQNNGPNECQGALHATYLLKFLGCWFGQLEAGKGTYWQTGQLVLGQDGCQPGWGVACGAATRADAVHFEPYQHGTRATLCYHFRLAPGQTQSWQLLLTVGQHEGWIEADQHWKRLYPLVESLFGTPPDEHKFLAGLPQLISSDQTLVRDFALAQANLKLMQADYPALGRYLLAGLPEYPQLFGCDTTYTVPGAVAGGFSGVCRSALEQLAHYARRACGRVPHEVTTNGRVFNPGNIPETPQFVIACWDYIRWTGDLEFARRVYAVCREGVLNLVPAFTGPTMAYPYGDGMIERFGMGAHKLDSACYLCAGLMALADIARVLGQEETPDIQVRAAKLREQIERDWWLEDEGLYADSMHSDGRLQLDGHWTVIVPVQLGIAAPDRALRVLERVERDLVNQWGLVHTRGVDEQVWTLPTGLLALAEFAYGRAALALQHSANIALTAQHGTLGTFKELIPQGLCFVQLWSAGLYLQAIVEGLLGVRPNAPAHELTLAPSLPPNIAPITLRGLQIGSHQIDLTVSPQGISIDQHHSSEPLVVLYQQHRRVVPPGQTLRLAAQ